MVDLNYGTPEEQRRDDFVVAYATLCANVAWEGGTDFFELAKPMLSEYFEPYRTSPDEYVAEMTRVMATVGNLAGYAIATLDESGTNPATFTGIWKIRRTKLGGDLA